MSFRDLDSCSKREKIASHFHLSSYPFSLSLSRRVSSLSLSLDVYPFLYEKIKMVMVVIMMMVMIMTIINNIDGGIEITPNQTINLLRSFDRMFVNVDVLSFSMFYVFSELQKEGTSQTQYLFWKECESTCEILSLWMRENIIFKRDFSILIKCFVSFSLKRWCSSVWKPKKNASALICLRKILQEKNSQDCFPKKRQFGSRSTTRHSLDHQYIQSNQDHVQLNHISIQHFTYRIMFHVRIFFFERWFFSRRRRCLSKNNL